jgi:chromosome segregation ATPase
MKQNSEDRILNSEGETMTEEQKTEDRRQNPEANGAPHTDDLATIKAELEAERKKKIEIETEIAKKDKTIADLEKALAERDARIADLDVGLAEAATIKPAYFQAVEKYLGAVKSLNPTIPADVITGSTIKEIDDSLAKALTIATAVKASLEAQAKAYGKETKVPAGAPTRGSIALEAMSPREKIAAGLQQQRRHET